jgi:hypothetical protein
VKRYSGNRAHNARDHHGGANVRRVHNFRGFLHDTTEHIMRGRVRTVALTNWNRAI